MSFLCELQNLKIFIFSINVYWGNAASDRRGRKAFGHILFNSQATAKVFFDYFCPVVTINRLTQP